MFVQKPYYKRGSFIISALIFYLINMSLYDISFQGAILEHNYIMAPSC